jgi:hypothetical protein
MTKHTLKITIASTLCCLLFGLAANAQTNSSPAAIATDGSHLSGSWRKPEQLITQADAIFTGQILDLGLPDFEAAGSPIYGARVKVLQSFKGTIAGEVVVMLHVTNLGSITEKKPVLNHTYILFVRTSTKSNAVELLKIMEGSADNIAKVKELIASTSAGK